MRRLVIAACLVTLTAGPVLVAGTAGAATRYVVTASASSPNVDVGTTSTLRGKVSPGAKDQRVLVQRLAPGGWITVQRPQLNRYSYYKATVRVPKAGENKYRVIKPGTSAHPTGYSPTVTVNGWRWRYLTTLPLAASPSSFLTDEFASGVLRENTYAPFIRQGPDQGSGYYVLDGKCTEFEAVVGVSAESATNDPASVFLFGSTVSTPAAFNTLGFNGDAVKKFNDPLYLYRGASVMADIAILQLRSSGIEASNYVGWGRARVYCKS